MPDFWTRFLFALLYKFINGDCVLFVMGFLGGVLPMLFVYWMLHRGFRAWVWVPVCILAGIAGAIWAHNAWEWWVVNWWMKPLGEPMHIITGGKVL